MAFSLPLAQMSTADKLQTMETLWDDLCHKVEDICIPEWHYEVLAAREEDIKTGKECFTDWEIAKETIRESLK
ncbi:MAG: addiction module protein [Desulfuromonadales bacterium]